LRHTHRLAQRQVETELDGRIAVVLTAAPFSAGTTVPAHILVSQMSSEPQAFSAALYSSRLVVRYFGLVGAFMPSVYPRPEFAAAGLDLQQSQSYLTSRRRIVCERGAGHIRTLPLRHPGRAEIVEIVVLARLSFCFEHSSLAEIDLPHLLTYFKLFRRSYSFGTPFGCNPHPSIPNSTIRRKASTEGGRPITALIPR
jgi:hypothetical protein